MLPFLPTIILRHRKENLRKCSLRGLETRKDFNFFSYPKHQLPNLSNYFLLTIDAPPLSKKDSNLGIFLIDATWKYAEKMEQSCPPTIQKRSIPPSYRTAYPRKQTKCPNPARGLSSIEALYITYLLLGYNTAGLLDNYYWKDEFLTLNGL